VKQHERCQPNRTSEQGWRRKEPTPRRKQSTQAKQLTARNKNALVRVTQENKNNAKEDSLPLYMKLETRNSTS